MTIGEALEACDRKQPNQFTKKQKIAWLSVLDGQIFDFLQAHEDMTEAEAAFDGYTEDTPLGTEMLAGAPYDEVYGYFLSSKIEYMLDEIDRYNVSASLFAEAYDGLKRWIHKTRRPVQRAKMNWNTL